MSGNLEKKKYFTSNYYYETNESIDDSGMASDYIC